MKNKIYNVEGNEVTTDQFISAIDLMIVPPMLRYQLVELAKSKGLPVEFCNKCHAVYDKDDSHSTDECSNRILLKTTS